MNGADAVSFDAAILSHAVGRPVRVQFSRQDEMMWENLGSACMVEHRAGITPDGRIAAWDREGWVASLGNRPGYDQPGNVISGMLAGYPPEPLEPGPAKPPTGLRTSLGVSAPPAGAGERSAVSARSRIRCGLRSSPGPCARLCGFRTRLPTNALWMSSARMRRLIRLRSA